MWRYDRPQAGRYREFYQADADIIGSYSTDCEVELLLMATEVLKGFDLPDYKLVINNRKILEAQVRVAGIPPEKKADALRALDKLLKIGKDGMREEFGQATASPPKQFEEFFATIVVETLDDAAARVQGDEAGEKGVAELREIFAKAERLGFADKLKFDWTLVRGLDYYTGPMFEAQAQSDVRLRQLRRRRALRRSRRPLRRPAAGRGRPVVRRRAAHRAHRGARRRPRTRTPPPVLVAPADDAQVEAAERLALALRARGVATRFIPAMKRDKMFKYSTAAGLPQLILVGADEAASGVYALRTQGGTEQKLDTAGLVAALSRSG